MMPTRLILIASGLLALMTMGQPGSSHARVENTTASAELSGADNARVESDGEWVDGVGPIRVEADPEAGFEYPYYLYSPKRRSDATTPVLVESNNSPRPTDEYDAHLREVENKMERGLGRHISDELTAPLVMPVFPRPVSDPVDWTHSIQQLDLETMRIDGGPLERIDLQLLHMVEDARRRLDEAGHGVGEGIMMNGFSGSGSFANRFAALHPEEVISVTAGGINGMPILPYSEVEGNPVSEDETFPLVYQVGVANLEDLTGKPLDRDAFRDVKQFLYIGGNDHNDPLPYPDVFTGKDVRLAALLAYGDRIHEDRFPRASKAYDDFGADAVFRVYEEAGHTPEPAVSDVVEFHRRVLAGDDLEAIRADLGGNVQDPPDDIGLRE